MEIQVEYKDQNGIISHQTRYISLLAFLKHMAFAGQRYAPYPSKILKSLGMFLHYRFYLQRDSFDNDRFSVPPNDFSDPTEKGQFSNIAGKAIADFLAKKIDNALYTVNYEAAMRKLGLPVIGERPDLLAFTNNDSFAIEAKGYSRDPGNMDLHKAQSEKGEILVNFSVACVSYNLYNKVRCKYYDPIKENVPFNKELFKELTKEYYRGFYKLMNYCNINEVQYQNETFYELDFFNYLSKESKDFKKYQLLYYLICISRLQRIKLIIPKNIEGYAINGLTNDTPPFIFNQYLKEKEGYDKVYIDNDRIGLSIM